MCSTTKLRLIMMPLKICKVEEVVVDAADALTRENIVTEHKINLYLNKTLNF